MFCLYFNTSWPSYLTYTCKLLERRQGESGEVRVVPLPDRDPSPCPHVPVLGSSRGEVEDDWRWTLIDMIDGLIVPRSQGSSTWWHGLKRRGLDAFAACLQLPREVVNTWLCLHLLHPPWLLSIK